MKGIDVSHHQGDINFTVVAAGNVPKIEFVFIKATEGSNYTDPKLKFNCFQAKNAGLKIGYYHFATLNTENVVEDAKSEAQYFISTISKLTTADLPLILDIESNKASLSPDKVIGWIKTFFDELVSLGHSNYALYSYTPFLNENLPKDHGLGNIKLWIAAYTSGPAPKLPHGWSDYWIWQYSAKGSVQGVRGTVDMNDCPGQLL